MSSADDSPMILTTGRWMVKMRTIPYILLNGDDFEGESLFRKIVERATLKMQKEHLRKVRQRASESQRELAALPGKITNRMLNHLRAQVRDEFCHIGDDIVAWMDSMVGANVSPESVIEIISRLMRRDVSALLPFRLAE